MDWNKTVLLNNVSPYLQMFRGFSKIVNIFHKLSSTLSLPVESSVPINSSFVVSLSEYGEINGFTFTSSIYVIYSS